MTRYLVVILMITATVALIFAPTGCTNHSVPTAETGTLAGIWVYEATTTYTTEKITLILRIDGTYTKTLEASSGTLRGLGGTHSGTWQALGTSQVRLSGSAQWPDFTHDLAQFRKID